MTDYNLNPYMIFDVIGNDVGAALVFANNAREAKVVGRSAEVVWESDYIDIRVRRIKGFPEHLMAAADPEKMAAGVPHYEEMVLPGCEGCEMWGAEIVPDETGYCEECRDGRRD